MTLQTSPHPLSSSFPSLDLTQPTLLRWFVGLLACLVLLSLPYLDAHAQTCDYVKTARLGSSNLNIRQTPDTSLGAVGSVPEGVCLKVIEKTDQGQSVSGNRVWYKITHNGATGWISGHYADCSDCGGKPECTDGQTQACYTGPDDARNKGICKDGTQTCASGKWGTCSGEVKPGSEVCDGKDNDCDGQTDEEEGTTASCDTGISGPCASGRQRCVQGKATCVAESKTNEICDGVDNDCNGQIDDNLTRNCYTGPANTNGIGICKGGTQTCASGKWDTCTGEVKPAAKETCGDNKDDNCNGSVDEGCNPGCNDNDKDGYSSGTGCNNTAALDCDDNDKDVNPGATEICGNGKDDDCKGGDQSCNGNQNKGILGQKGCSGPADCASGTCAKVGQEARCTQPCKVDNDCPKHYLCFSTTACWPTTEYLDKTPCNDAKPCTKGETCTEGFCKAQGCGCQSTPHNPSWLALLLLLLLLHRRRA